jgi:hypothetical protein
MKLISRITLALVSLLTAFAVAQGSSPNITVAPVPTVVVTRGGHAQLTLELRVNRGFHVNSNHPYDELLMPTTLRLNAPDGIMIANLKYPEGQDLVLPFMNNQKLNVYSGAFVVTADVRPARTVAFGTERVHGAVKFQACDDRQCFPPRTVPFEFDVKVIRPVVHKAPAKNADSPHIHP